MDSYLDAGLGQNALCDPLVATAGFEVHDRSNRQLLGQLLDSPRRIRDPERLRALD